jgi:hypothetical protein
MKIFIRVIRAIRGDTQKRSNISVAEAWRVGILPAHIAMVRALMGSEVWG